MLALIGVLVVGLLLPSWQGVLVMLGVLVLCVAVDLALAAGVRRLTFTRAGAVSVRTGEPCSVRLTVHNPGRRLRGVLRDAWAPSAGVVADRVAVDVPAGGSRTLTFELRPVRRGDRAADRVTVRSVGPLGIAARQGSHEVPWTVRALPPFHSRRHLPPLLERLRELDGRRASLIRGAGTEFDSLRTYVIGDDVRSIDWRASARSTDVVVRTWRPERDRQVLIVLDTARTAAARVDGSLGGLPRLDTSMDAALLLSALAIKARDQVGFLAHSGKVRASVPRATVPLLVDAMAPLEAELVEFDARGMVAEVLRRAARRSLVVLLTSLEPSIEHGLLPLLPALTARHRLLIASVSDPAVHAMAAGRGDLEAVYSAAAAERTLAERRRLTALLARHGVEVVDAVPDDLPRALADRYLSLKAAGKL
ncbi:lipoprotein [Nocardia sp. NRRL S-836]|nr:lipoprotein [Nocardia sp. NRRL S-836]